jgi:hypothetical protein
VLGVTGSKVQYHIADYAKKISIKTAEIRVYMAAIFIFSAESAI